jgi:hypothetical protein
MAAGPADAPSPFQGGAAGAFIHHASFIHSSSSGSGGGSDSSLENLWSSNGVGVEVVATASTGASWVDEVHNNSSNNNSQSDSSSEPLEKRLEEIRRKFHRGRLLQIKHLPREVTEEVSYSYTHFCYNIIYTQDDDCALERGECKNIERESNAPYL